MATKKELRAKIEKLDDRLWIVERKMFYPDLSETVGNNVEKLEVILNILKQFGFEISKTPSQSAKFNWKLKERE